MNFDMKNTRVDYEIKGGIKGNIERILSYNVYAAYSLVKDMYFYYNNFCYNDFYGYDDYKGFNDFVVFYDEVQEWNIAAEIEANYQFVKAILKADYHNYKLSSLSAPFHRPAFNISLNTNFIVAKYLILSANAYAQSKSAWTTTGPYYLPEVYYNDALLDVGLGAEYLFNRNFSAFVNVDNILNNRYMIWNLYKTPGIHVEGGITLKF
jgi:predicted porin